jgi:hypothetical protein
MILFKVTYQTLNVQIGPTFIESDSEYKACCIFAKRGGFSPSQMALIKATKATEWEVMDYLLQTTRRSDEEQEIGSVAKVAQRSAS